jgi:hypothetical protein
MAARAFNALTRAQQTIGMWDTRMLSRADVELMFQKLLKLVQSGPFAGATRAPALPCSPRWR